MKQTLKQTCGQNKTLKQACKQTLGMKQTWKQALKKTLKQTFELMNRMRPNTHKGHHSDVECCRQWDHLSDVECCRQWECTLISGASSRLDTSLFQLGAALTTSFAMCMTTGNRDVTSMMAEDSGITPSMAGESGIISMMAGGSDMAAMTVGSSGMADILANDSGVVAILVDDSGMAAILAEDFDVAANLAVEHQGRRRDALGECLGKQKWLTVDTDNGARVNTR